jgi:hypothetical protein
LIENKFETRFNNKKAIMRKFTFIAIISAGLFSCYGKQNQGAEPIKKSHVDSQMTVARYVLGNTGKVDEQLVKRYIRDTLIQRADTVGNQITITKVPGKDTIYQIPVVDTLRDKGKPVFDSLKRPKFQVNYYLLPARWVLIDYNKSF